MNLNTFNRPLQKTPQRLALLGFALMAFSCASGESKAQSADEILSDIRNAESKIQYSATQVVQHGSSREVARVYRCGAKRRLEWISPSVKNGDVLVDDGQKVWLYHSAEKTAIQTNSTGRVPGPMGSDWELGSATQYNGRPARILTHSGGRQVTIDVATKAVMKYSSPTSTTSLQDVKLGAVPANKFQFTPPAGVKTTTLNGTLYGSLTSAKRKSDWFYAPTTVPDGYSLESVIVGPAEVWLRYTNGKQRFSIFQQKADGADVAATKVDGGWFWKSKGLRFLATGAPEGSVSGMASSLK